ncbi:DNA polymerase delta subunit 4 [Penicillium lagena]|uniref:DNA polymerase delta subunit 4 n=1 Tax=Penicillium lagena TaxID=94218 RepID=UPI0025413EA8|nr:DNA polymerase delta subunit 4 [Penicillium lagena]KAJ5611226.1 DNA polymerase delta subunit 4 [Penicillium lagena]
MPPRRRGGASAPDAQRTLSFGAQSRVSKPTTAAQKAKNLDSVKATSAIPELQKLPEAPAEPSQPLVTELAVRQQAAKAIQEPRSEEDKRALKLRKQDLQRYWKKEEQNRKAPRVHQQGLDLDEQILRHFDLSSQYGPCIGITRLKRWRRAHRLNLSPPIEVLAVLLKDEDHVKERAHMDELLS